MIVALGGGLQVRAIRWASDRSSILRYRWACDWSLSTPQPILDEAPLDIEHCIQGRIQGLGHLGRRPALLGLEQDASAGRNSGRTPP